MFRRPALFGSLLLLLSLAGSPALAAGFGVTSGLTNTHEVSPGSTVSDKIILANNTDTATRVRVYQTDYFFKAGGDAKYDPPGSHNRSNGKWITLGGTEIITVLPKSQLELPYTIKVPEKVNAAGTYWSMIMLEPLDETDARITPPTADRSLTIKQVFRYAVQLITNVQPGNSKASLALTEPKIERDKDGRYGLSVTLLNDGEIAQRPNVYAEVYNGAAQLVGRVEGVTGRVYPGTSTRQKFVFPTLPEGAYQVLVVSDNGDQNVYGVRYNFNVAK